jgi:hypothetical protein
MKSLHSKIIQFKKFIAWLDAGKRVTQLDINKCTTCKYNINDNCRVGSHYANLGIRETCIKGELWKAAKEN